MVRIAMMVPESYQLFINPAACGRHGALGAISHGIKHRLSYYFVEEEDIVQGYDNLIFQAVEELLKYLAERKVCPRVLMLFVTCIDDLMGTDTEALIQELEERYPSIYFIICHMNPIRDNGKEPPLVSVHKNIYPLLYREKISRQDWGINCLGNLEMFPEECELYSLVSMLSAGPLRHISQYERFDEFLRMGESVCNFVFASPALAAARELEKHCGQHMIPMEIHTYPNRIRKQYEEMGRQLSVYLKKGVPEGFFELLNECEKNTEYMAKITCGYLWGCPVAVDDFACDNPFELALFLLDNGFNVKWVVYKEPGGQALEDRETLKRKFPEVKMICSLDYQIPFFLSGNLKKARRTEAPGLSEKDEKLLAIGLEGAYILNADYVVDVSSTQGRYGYHGLQEIFLLMQEAYGKQVDLQHMIEGHGLVV